MSIQAMVQGAYDPMVQGAYDPTATRSIRMPALLLIPDISGFTDFVNATEVKHSKHIIQELLELIIDSDELGLTVSEIEGDAVLFYSPAASPSLELIVSQARKTFLAFHSHLKRYENRRICPCGACATAHNLTLKFIAHRADLDFITIKDQRKPYGSDVILAHRLLKNDVSGSEYLLLTTLDNHQADEPDSSVPAWAELKEGVTRYPVYGDVKYTYMLLDKLHREVEEPPPMPSFERIENPVRVEGTIPAPIHHVYEVISNLDLRLQWNTDVDDLNYRKERINRVGTRHQCVVQGELIDFETVVADFGKDTLVYGELVDKDKFVDRFAIFWVMTEGPDDTTQLAIELHYVLKNFPRNLLGFLFRFGGKIQLKKVFANIQAAIQGIH